jgi:hypothetical protein
MNPLNSDDHLDSRCYEAAPPGSLAEKFAILARKRIFSDFMRLARPSPTDTILDVGVSDIFSGAANVIERCYSYPHNVTAAGLSGGADFAAAFPEIEYRQIEANEPLPFPNRSFDIATSNAVLEHVGSVEAQERFLRELCRVARRVFVTVPNRFFPFEHHTRIPLLHWNDAVFTVACNLLHLPFWSRRENLILMSMSKLAAVTPAEVSSVRGYTGLRLGFWSSNLYLLVTSAA